MDRCDSFNIRDNSELKRLNDVNDVKEFPLTVLAKEPERYQQ